MCGFNLLNESNQWDLYENDYLKYSIKKLYTTNKFMNTGQKIDVLLPFSKQTYYTEYLMNLEYITNVFNDNYAETFFTIDWLFFGSFLIILIITGVMVKLTSKNDSSNS